MDFACEYEKQIENVKLNFDVTQERFQNLRVSKPRLSSITTFVGLSFAKHFENYSRIFILPIPQEKFSTKQIFPKTEKLES